MFRNFNCKPMCWFNRGILIHDFMEGDTYNFSGKYKQCYEILDKYWLFGNTEEEITKATNELMYSGRTSTDAYTFITENREMIKD